MYKLDFPRAYNLWTFGADFSKINGANLIVKIRNFFSFFFFASS